MLDQVESPGRRELAERLLHDEIGRAGIELDGGGGSDRPERIVKGHRRIRGIGDRGDLLGLENAADVDGVRLQSADFVARKWRLQMVFRVATLAGREPGADGTTDLGECLYVLRIARLLDPV